MIPLSKPNFFTDRPDPGFYAGVDDSIYHSWNLASSHRLGVIHSKSAASLRNSIDNPKDPTDALVEGSAAHCLVIEPELFDHKFVVSGQCQETKKSNEQCTNAGKYLIGRRWLCGTHVKGDRYDASLQATVAKLKESGYRIRDVSEARSHYLEHPKLNKIIRISDHAPNAKTLQWMLSAGVESIRVDIPPYGMDDVRRVLTADQFERMNGAAQSVLKHDAGAWLMNKVTHRELSMVWDCSATGVRCRGRMDMVCDGIGVVTDLKTISDEGGAKDENLAREINNYGYHRQAAFYLYGMAQLGLIFEKFVIIAVEKVKPFAVNVKEIGQESLAIGYEDCMNTLAAYAECERTGVWPAYSNKIGVIEIPGYARRRREFDGSLA
jgi:PDDEXK-like domain of unknown function (DUF3799)